MQAVSSVMHELSMQVWHSALISLPRQVFGPHSVEHLVVQAQVTRASKASFSPVHSADELVPSLVAASAQARQAVPPPAPPLPVVLVVVVVPPPAPPLPVVPPRAAIAVGAGGDAVAGHQGQRGHAPGRGGEEPAHER